MISWASATSPSLAAHTDAELISLVHKELSAYDEKSSENGSQDSGDDVPTMILYDSDQDPPSLIYSTDSDTDSDEDGDVQWRTANSRFEVLPDGTPTALTGIPATPPTRRRPQTEPQTPARTALAYTLPPIGYQRLNGEHGDIFATPLRWTMNRHRHHRHLHRLHHLLRLHLKRLSARRTTDRRMNTQG